MARDHSRLRPGALLARDPIDFARTEVTKMRASGQSANPARNGNFSSDKAASFEGKEVAYHQGGSPAGWDYWQTDKSKGTFTWDRQTGVPGGPPGAGRIAGVAEGCLIQVYRVQPGERYAVSAVQRTAGKGHGAINVRWQTADGTWIHQTEDVFVYPQSVAGSSSAAWSSLFGTVEVPEGVGRLVVLLGVGTEHGVRRDLVRQRGTLQVTLDISDGGYCMAASVITSEKLAVNGGTKTVTNKLAGWPKFDENAIRAVEAVLRSGKVNYWTGPNGMEFEKSSPGGKGTNTQ